MVSNIIDGIFGNPSRINPESLSLEAKAYLKTIREDIQNRNSIDKTLSTIAAQTILRYFQEYGESPLALLPELTTVSYYVIGGFRQYIANVTFYFILGVTHGLLRVCNDRRELADCLDQLLVAVFTNPIFEFTVSERDTVVGMVHQVRAYLSTIQFYSGQYGELLDAASAALLEGMKNGLEICNAPIDEIQSCAVEKAYVADRWLGALRFYSNLCWPIWNITAMNIVLWIKRKTGIELWPVED
jgi:hypothetical protein